MVTLKPLNLSLISISTISSHGQSSVGYLNATNIRTHNIINIHRDRTDSSYLH